MNKNLALAALTFALLSVVIGLSAQIALEFLGITSALAGFIGAFLITTPVALIVARRTGRLTRLSVLMASLAVTLTTLSSIVFIFNSIAEPVGGHVGWASLFNGLNWRNTFINSTATLIVPQLWLSLFNRLAAN